MTRMNSNNTNDQGLIYSCAFVRIRGKFFYYFLTASLLLCLLLGLTACFSAVNDEEGPPPGDTTISPHGGPLVLVHYMPWFDGPSYKSEETTQSKYQGHWSDWGRYNPATAKPNGQANIVGHYYPLTGPYHSSSTAILEYQASLLKIAGMDGIIFDWYGAYVANDFGINHEHTKAMVAVLKRANLKFLALYEDNTLNMMGKSGDEALTIGKYSFDWAQANWFKDAAYIRYEGRPVVMCFGPQHFKTKDTWDTVFSGVNLPPWFVSLLGHYSMDAVFFNWFPPMSRMDVDNGAQSIANINPYLDGFYNNSVQKAKPYRIATVFSAFHDDYADGGWGYLPYNNGEVFDQSWKKAMGFNPHIIQIATWNDYGEGTIIEPTIERGYRELEYVQGRIREWDKTFPFTKEDLRWPLEFYKLRYTQTAAATQEAAIKAAINALFAGNAAVFRNEAVKTGATVDVNDLKPLLR